MTPSLLPIRRKDKAVEDPAWIQTMLHQSPYGVLATSQNDQPYAKPSLYVYNEQAGCLYLHGALQGRTPDSLRDNPKVCFCVSAIGRLLPASTAFEFGVEYASVIVFGTLLRVEDEGEARQALQQILDKYFPHLRPGEHYRPITQPELGHTAVYRIEIESWSGKQARAPVDFPGAFPYRSGGLLSASDDQTGT
jgi:hypothetical protein